MKLQKKKKEERKKKGDRYTKGDEKYRDVPSVSLNFQSSSIGKITSDDLNSSGNRRSVSSSKLNPFRKGRYQKRVEITRE